MDKSVLSRTDLKVLIVLVFASGKPAQNQALIERAASSNLYVISEFEPARGRWIPWHVFRPLKENLKAIRAELLDHKITAAHIALAPGTAYAPMRIAALILATGKLTAWDENLKPVTAWDVSELPYGKPSERNRPSTQLVAADIPSERRRCTHSSPHSASARPYPKPSPQRRE